MSNAETNPETTPTNGANASPIPSSPFYSHVPVPGKEYGMVANTLIPTGTTLITEPSLITLPADLIYDDYNAAVAAVEAQFIQLSSEYQTQVLSLYHSPVFHEGNHLLGIFKTNAVTQDGSSEGREDYAILLNGFSRFNHACSPNCEGSWMPASKTHVLRTTRDVQEGEELTVAYTDVFQTTGHRREALMGSHGFVCMCSVCGLDIVERQERDELLRKLKRMRDLSEHLLGENLDKEWEKDGILLVLRREDELLKQLCLTGSFEAGPYGIGASIKMNSDPLRCFAFQSITLEILQRCHGEDHPDTIRMKERVVESRSLLMDEQLENIPTDPVAFSDWLWFVPDGKGTVMIKEMIEANEKIGEDDDNDSRKGNWDGEDDGALSPFNSEPDREFEDSVGNEIAGDHSDF